MAYERILAQNPKNDWARQWHAAQECLAQVLKLDPGDYPSERLKKWIVAYQQNPPPAEWAGEYVHTAKD